MTGTNTLPSPDANLGQSALLLVESLIHALVERAVLPLDEAIEIALTACDVLHGANLEIGLDEAECARSAAPLKAIHASLQVDKNPARTQA
ncbi:cupredoxin domain-containing protein [Sphingomonas prati]|uniref:Uncharacterized protein n=1 Tax=Sphingomonas prati TaxID=1843237 RepID=A0A7W9F1Q7_9SPHN|nr:hypothetical protein [Sphingomonas prati]MBB5728014.1 hypothetical protein [Sphingomonas prati]GGE82606.1 hypothetical protein GCM10011404_14090 [Sphingomonas prati]